MLKVEYSKDGIVLSDHEAYNFVRNTIRNYSNTGPDVHVVVANELTITAFRVAVKRKEIPHDQIQFMFENYGMNVDKGGRIDHWPRGFCDFNDNFLSTLLDM